MRAKVDCIPCILNQDVRAARAAVLQKEGRVSVSLDSDLVFGEQTIRALINRVALMIPGFDLSKTPPEVAYEVYKLVQKVTGVKDPYALVKKAHIEQALELYPYLADYVNKADDKLLAAIKVAILGNSIDLGSYSSEVDVKSLLRDLEQGRWEIVEEDLKLFRELLIEADKVLYIADNAGETVFDRPLLEMLVGMELDVKYAVRGSDIVNDATKKDALYSGIPEHLIMETGSDYAGIVLSDCSERFRKRFLSSDLIIAKGQGNFETLSGVKAPIFFLLKAKCNPVASELKVPRGTMVFKKSLNFVSKLSSRA